MNNKNNKIEENNYVVKANQLIESKGRLGTLEQKLLAALISEIQLSDEDFKDYYLKISDISDLLGITSNTIYERLKEASDNLMSKSIKLEDINKRGKKTFIVTRLISSAMYQEGEGAIKMRFDPVLKPYLIAIKGKETPFTKYMLKNILKLNNSYSIRLYELLKQWERTRKKEFEIEELKEFLGVDAESYNRFDNFERRVLKVAKNEINEHTDLFVIYKKIKTGRRISHIEFEIETKIGYFNPVEEEHKHFEESGSFDYEFVKVNSGMREEKFSREQIYEIYNLAIQKTSSYGVDELAYIQMNYQYAKERAQTGLYSYVIKAIKSDYAKAILKLAQIEM